MTVRSYLWDKKVEFIWETDEDGIDGKINWIIASGVASGFLFGSIVMYLWQRNGEIQRT
ncbi:MAG: hypothetical protein GQ533_02355 [Methanosarcinaceae archaeon]|nr:hypothetical protein [Methanosarcinaceae archaeon]